MGAALQQAIYARLSADASLIALLAADVYEGSPSRPAIYDHVLQPSDAGSSSAFPYVVIGDSSAISFDTDDVNGQEATVTLHVWDRREGSLRAKQVADAIYSSLHGADFPVFGQNLIFCYFDFRESIPDPEPLTKHEVIRFRIVTQQ